MRTGILLFWLAPYDSFGYTGYLDNILFPTICLGLNVFYLAYSHHFNRRGGWNKCGGGAKVAKSLNVEVGINLEGGIFWKKLVHNTNKRGVEVGKI